MFKEKNCNYCNKTYVPTGPAQLVCKECKPLLPTSNREYYNRAQKKHRLKKGCEVGVGSGNHSLNKGVTHSQYSTGITFFRREARRLKELIGLCQRCNKDIRNASKHMWAGHHIDHDRTNNKFSNLEILCKRCHMIEHECVNNFEGSTTREKSRTSKQEEAVSGYDVTDDIV